MKRRDIWCRGVRELYLCFCDLVLLVVTLLDDAYLLTGGKVRTINSGYKAHHVSNILRCLIKFSYT